MQKQLGEEGGLAGGGSSLREAAFWYILEWQIITLLERDYIMFNWPSEYCVTQNLNELQNEFLQS